MNRETQLINLWYNGSGVPLDRVREDFEQLIRDSSPVIRDFVNQWAINWEELETIWNNQQEDQE